MLSVKRQLRPAATSRSQLSDRQRRFYDFLRANPVGVLSTVTPDGEPHGVVIYFMVDERFGITFLTRSETKKYDNLKRNAHVMLTVYEPSSQTTVQMTGRAHEVTDGVEVNAIAGNIAGIGLHTSRDGLLPITKLQAGAFVAFKVTPVQCRMAVYARPDFGGYGELFESLESFDLIV